MTNEIKVVIYGVGPIGERIAKAILKKKGLKIVGAIDIAKDKVGKDLGDVIGIKRKLGVNVSDNPDSLLHACILGKNLLRVFRKVFRQ